jgi:hypothetical protein
MQLRRKVIAGALGAAALILATGTAGARPASTSTSWIALEQPAASDAKTAGAWEPSLGELVTFASSAPSNVKNPRIEVLCYQNGALVYGEAGSADQVFQENLTGYPGFILGGSSSLWLQSGGAADCTGNLYYFGSKAGVQTYNVLATTKFAAAG